MLRVHLNNSLKLPMLLVAFSFSISVAKSMPSSEEDKSSSSKPKILTLYHDAEHKKKRQVYLPESSYHQLESRNIGYYVEHPLLTSILAESHEHSLTKKMSPSKDQGQSMACVPFCVVACLEYVHPSNIMSEASIARWANQIYNNEEHTCDTTGATRLIDAMAFVRDYGASDKSAWSFDENNICGSPPANWLKLLKYRFKWVDRVFWRSNDDISINVENDMHSLRLSRLRNNSNLHANVDITSVDWSKDLYVGPIRRLIYQEYPVIVEIPLFYNDRVLSCGWGDGRSGIILPEEDSLNIWNVDRRSNRTEAFHAITLTGYDDNQARFEFKNSWGSPDEQPWWGNKGFSTIPYEYIKRYARIGMYGSLADRRPPLFSAKL